jgi:hypothetical protein
MPSRRKWTKSKLEDAVKSSKSLRQVIKKLGLIPAGGNYEQIKKYIAEYSLDTKHFTGKAWNKGMRGIGKPFYSMEEILVKESHYQSYKLKARLFKDKLKKPVCEKCRWAKYSKDGRLPLELHHINGDRRDNRLVNLMILCPNCHSLEPNHRARNMGRKK